jgi:septal ring factor EnvC (AmiA/AmiB activator)
MSNNTDAQLKKDLAKAKKEIERLKRELRTSNLKLGMSASHCDSLNRLLLALMEKEDKKNKPLT